MMRVWLPVVAVSLGWAVGCGGGDVASLQTIFGQPSSVSGSTTPEGDALLESARAGIVDGQLRPDTRAALLASSSDRHARARRILAGLDAAGDSPAQPASTDDDTFDVPALELATPPPNIEAAAPDPARRGVVVPKPARPTAQRTSAPTAAPAPAPVRARAATLRTVVLRSTSRGASLTLSGTQGLVVGVANQPRSGIVRLVVEAGASAKALAARPRITGAKVTSVRRTGKTVFVTLALDPGWSLAGIVRTKAGARVNLRRNA